MWKQDGLRGSVLLLMFAIMILNVSKCMYLNVNVCNIKLFILMQIFVWLLLFLWLFGFDKKKVK